MDDLDDDLGGDPNCPRCLVRLELWELNHTIVWWCAECDLISLTAPTPE